MTSAATAFPSAFQWWNVPRETLDMAGVSLNRRPISTASTQFDWSIVMSEVEDQLLGAIEYNTDLYDADTIERVIRHYENVLTLICQDPRRPVGDLLQLPSVEEHRLLVEWNDTEESHGRDEPVHALFEAQVSRTPDAVAVATPRGQLTYRELDRRAGLLAARLQRMGVGPEIRVGLCLDRSPELVVALLGVLKAGGAYVPLDPAYPTTRLRMIMDDAELAAVVTQGGLDARLGDHETPVIALDEAWHDISAGDALLEVEVSADNLAYVTFTSGSTGRPKGVQITHGSVVNFLKTIVSEPGLDRDDTLLAVTTISFDISVLELFLPLVSGARLVVGTADVSRDGRRLAELMRREGVTTMQATPATWHLLLDAGWTGGRGLRVFTGGQALSPELAQRLTAAGGSVWNLYGPTETTIWSTVDRVQQGRGAITIGRPIADTRTFVLDRAGRPVPVGVVGELLIGGAGLSRGYRGRPAETAERFVPDPFDGEGGGRLYRTGDRARYLKDGRLVFLGREDHQVKIRGYRIELGEIEAVLERFAGVNEAIVVAREDERAGDLLVAYVTTEGAPPDELELRRHAQETLPIYMVPTAIVALDDFPLTPNGKVDRSALPAPVRERPSADAFRPPATELEIAIADIWASVLPVDDIGVDDKFFDLGGHSLSAVQVVTRAREELGVDIDFNALVFETLGQIAAACEGADRAELP